jgi:energy-coupling factor transporter ATP-binding protein EcfA2
MNGGETVVAIEDLQFSYPGGVVALDGISIEIGRGTALGIVGQNGSGKTTLAKHLNGLLRPTAGRVVVEGLDTARHPIRALARHVGYVFQNPGHQLFARTVADELAFGPRNLGVAADEIDARVAAVAETLQLTDVLAMHPYRLPLPMRKLVTIASVLTMRPSVLVLDEPTTGQDHRTSRRIAELIDGVRAGGATVVTVTHDMSLLAAVSDRVVVLQEGRVAADGTPRAILSDRALMAATRLRPPQVTELSIAMPGRGDRPGALSLAELVDELRGAT